MPFRTAEQIRADAIALLDSRGSGIRTDAGEPIVDLVDSFASEGERQNIIADYLVRINSLSGWRSVIRDETFKQSLANAFGISSSRLNADVARRLGAPADITTDVEAVLYVDLGNYAYSYNRPRKAAVSATGTERLYLSSNTPFTLLRGAALRTAGSSTVIYDTVNDLIGAIPSFDFTRNQFYVDVAVKCRTPGRVGNKIKGAVSVMVSPIPGVLAVSNVTAVEGGFDRETNEELLDAIETIMAGTDINTHNGLLKFVSAQPGVFDVVLVGPGHPLMTRASAGAVDLYIIGSDLQTDSVQIKVLVEGETVILPYQPVRQVNSVVKADTTPLSEGGGYVTVEDTGEFRGSAQGRTQIQWALPPPDGVGPVAGELLTVNFTHNALVRNIQRQLDDDPDREVPGSSILLKEGDRVPISFEMKVVGFPGVPQSTVEQAATQSLQDYLDSLGLGQMVEYSDALTAVATSSIDGEFVIDRVDGFKMTIEGGSLNTDNISITEKEYARLESISFIAP